MFIVLINSIHTNYKNLIKVNYFSNKNLVIEND